MPAFNYQALDEKGKTVKGILEGDSPRQIRAQLRDKSLKPISVEAANERQSKNSASSSDSFSLKNLFKPSLRMKPQELSLVTRQLATLVQANLPLDEALLATSKQVRRSQVKSILLEVRAKVLEGHSLAYALGEMPKVFNELYRSMVKAGEHAGFLGLVLEKLADYTETSQQTQQQIKMAMVYPIILMLVAVVVIGALLIFVVPKLVRVFENNNAELPVLTQVMISLSDFVSSYKMLIVAGIIAALVFAVKYWLRKEANRHRWHRVILAIPGLNTLAIMADSARFAGTLSVLTASGVPLLDGLRIAAAVMGNLVLRDAGEQAAVAVQEGSSLHKALDQAKYFPPMMVHMVASGEASGELETMLERVAANQERELQNTLTVVMSIFEPVMILLMAFFVLLIVISVLLPIIGMNNLV